MLTYFVFDEYYGIMSLQQQQLSQANYPYYSQVGYWGYPTAATPNQYQNVSQSTNAAAFIPQWPPASYNYPAANWWVQTFLTYDSESFCCCAHVFFAT